MLLCYHLVIKILNCGRINKEGIILAVKLNPNKEIVDTIKEGLKKTGGYCPCRTERTDDTKCMCKEFKKQIKDPNFEGYCHCMLYYKTID